MVLPCYSLSIQVTLSWVGGVTLGPLIEDEELRTSVFHKAGVEEPFSLVESLHKYSRIYSRPVTRVPPRPNSVVGGVAPGHMSIED